MDQQGAPPPGSSAGEKFGLIAGWGRYPIVVAEALRRQGYRIYCAAIHDHADPALVQACDDVCWVGVAQLGRTIRYFRRNGVSRGAMAGKIHKLRMFDRWALWRHFPDWHAVKTFYPHFLTAKKDRKDDTLLSVLVEAFAKEGIVLTPATDFAPELLVPAGCLTTHSPRGSQWKDIEFGWRLAKEMGRLDVGQSVAVKDRTILAVEAIEGTDACIRRAGELCRVGRFTVVKTAKPQQDMRFDVPTIGLLTLETMVAAGASVLAVEAERTIIIDRTRLVEFANRHKLTLVALTESQALGLSHAA